MYILPSEYVSIRKYGHLKFRYSWRHRRISTLQSIVYCVDYVKKHSVLHHWAHFLHFQKVVCEAGNKGILIFFLILISSLYFLALEKKKKIFFPKLRFPLSGARLSGTIFPSPFGKILRLSETFPSIFLNIRMFWKFAKL